MSAPVVDLVIKSWVNDFPWLTYSLRSIQKFCTGFRDVIVITEKGEKPPIGSVELHYEVVKPPHQEGYMHQQSIKLHADAFSDADFVLFADSDTIFTRPFSPADAITDGKVNWLYTLRSQMGEHAHVWRAATENAIRQSVEYEFMRRHPFCVPSWAFPCLRAFFWQAHGQSLESFIATRQGREFSEWNTMGAYLWFHHHDEVNWIDTQTPHAPNPMNQEWSWGGLTDDIRRKLERMLA